MSIFSREKHDIKAIRREVYKGDATIKRAQHSGYLKKKDIKEFDEHRIREEKLEIVLEKDFHKAIHKKLEVSKELKELTEPLIKIVKKVGQKYWGGDAYIAEEAKRRRKAMFKSIHMLDTSMEALIKASNELYAIIDSELKTTREIFKIEKFDWQDLYSAERLASKFGNKSSVNIDKKEIALDNQEMHIWSQYIKVLLEEEKQMHEVINTLKFLEGFVNKFKKLDPHDFSGEYVQGKRFISILGHSSSLLDYAVKEEEKMLKELRQVAKREIILEKLESKNLK